MSLSNSRLTTFARYTRGAITPLREQQEMGTLLENMRGAADQIDVEMYGDEIVFSSPAIVPMHMQDFGWIQRTTAGVFTVFSGTLNIHGDKVLDVAETEITCSGNTTGHIFVEHTFGSSTATIKFKNNWTAADITNGDVYRARILQLAEANDRWRVVRDKRMAMRIVAMLAS